MTTVPTAVAPGDVVTVTAFEVERRTRFDVMAVRPERVSNRTGKTIPAEFDAFDVRRDKHGRRTEGGLHSFYISAINDIWRGGEHMPTATATKKAPASGKKKTLAAKGSARGKRGQNVTRDAEIVTLAKAGKTKAEIAKKFGISPNAVHGVIWRVTHKKKG